MEETPTQAEPTATLSESTYEHLDVAYNHRLHCTCNKPVSQGYISILHPDWGAFCRCYISHTQMRMEIRAGRVD
jgi:hypothetical protein